MNEVDKKLQPYLFPVIEREVYHQDVSGKSSPLLTTDYKAIVRKDTGDLISIMNDTYKIVPNSEIIKPLIGQLAMLETPWYIDNSHSFVENERMRIMVTFPQLTFHDGRSDIALSLYLSNSYNGSESVKMNFGGIRFICSNGCVYGTVLGKFYGKHTAGINLSNLREQVESTYEKIPVIKHRIEQLLNEKVTDTIRMSVENRLGKKIMKYVDEQEEETQRAKNLWVLYNFLTYYISHSIEQRLRAGYQFEVSKLFKL